MLNLPKIFFYSTYIEMQPLHFQFLSEAAAWPKLDLENKI